MLKKISVLMLMLVPFLLNAQTNDFYDDAETNLLPLGTITIGGEISNPGIVDVSALQLRSVVVKEAVLNETADQFTGAYRFDGYSLYDLLNQVILKKKNEAAFPPIIDLYVEVENDKGDKVVLSWGEIYYPIHRHEILIATRVARIVPSKTKELWPLPVESKLVVASDLLTHRNISNPTKITVRSYEGEFTIKKGMKPMYADSFSILDGKAIKETVTNLPGLSSMLFPSVFYGRGTGIHGTTPFEGVLLKDVLAKYFAKDVESLKTGIFVMTGKDGYHAVYTYSEVMNRNDQAEVLLFNSAKDEDCGYFKLFPAADFFSDRAIKSLESIRFDRD
ncbi:MAG: hypothetical protein IPH45_04470 [Bacteroidales bacterium]|nr:hypothetical protein [Bacteroidales bacterium]